jgi:hypothetical protein
MIELHFTQKAIEDATKLSEEMGHLNNSITSSEGNIAGFLGEFIARRIMGGKISHTYEYDIVLKNGKTVDVKTKRTSVPPRPDYECSVAELNTTQKCDYYAFTRISYDYKMGWFLGYFPKKEYFQKSRYLMKGKIDGSNGFKVRSNCYNMRISDLYQIKKYDKTKKTS